MTIFIVDNEMTIIKEHSECKADYIGQKAYGLLKIPECWGLPFFVVSKNVFVKYSALTNEDRISFMDSISTRIEEVIIRLKLKDKYLIVRSSGLNEGMINRGEYYSKEIGNRSVVEAIVETFDLILGDKAIEYDEIALIVQEYLVDAQRGHISNERRFSKDNRDWAWQLDNGSDLQLNRLAVRNWREKVDLSQQTKKMHCTNIQELSKTLRQAITYFTEFKDRYHFEFVWNGFELYFVQADREIDPINGINPLNFSNKMPTEIRNGDFRILRTITEQDGKKFSKVNNLMIYKEIGLMTAPIYIIDSPYIFHEIHKGNFNLLKDDIEILCNKSLVIRLDINTDKQHEKQMLNRSNQLRTYDSVVDWLQKNIESILDKDAAILLHNFIPATSSAFVNAKPGRRIVDIQCSWGLPESLYYNSHDRITVDTQTVFADYLRVDEFELFKKEQFKEKFIAPVENGEWVEQRIGAPYDWKLSITNDSHIKQMAYESRLIAEKVGKELSIMWFVGIDEDYYNTPVLPWYHEEYDSSKIFDHEYITKKIKETEFTIRDYSDLHTLENNKSIKFIRINPKDDCNLRNKDFIKVVGEIAQLNDISIILEGAVLAHPLYQLLKTNAKVLLAKPYLKYEEKYEFNKLVRDKIPQKIIDNNEKVWIGKLDIALFKKALDYKIIEETSEVLNTKNDGDLLKELVDLSDVVLKRIELSEKYKDKIYNYSSFVNIGNEMNLQLFKKLHEYTFSLLDEEYTNICLDNNVVNSIVSYVVEEQSDLIIEIILNNFDNRKKINKAECQANKKQNQYFIDLMKIALKCKDALVEERKLFYLGEMLEKIEKICSKNRFEHDDFELIRKKKLETSGGFDEGIVLLKTMFSEDYELSNEYTLFDDISDYNFGYVSDLKIVTKKNQDLRKNNEKLSLLVRVKLPCYFNKANFTFSGNKVTDFFSVDSKFVVILERDGLNIHVKIYYYNYNKVNQLSF